MEKIRRRYDDYVTRFFKPKSLRAAFEDRYLEALRSRVDISSFLLAEIGAIDELTAREEKRVQEEAVEQPTGKQPGFADRVLEENRRRIASYPDVAFHEDAGEEVRRMAGALSRLERERWSDLGAALQNTMYAMSASEMLALDSRLRSLCPSRADEPPAFLARLMSELHRFPRSYAAIEREEKEYILEAAFFLNELHTVLQRVQEVHADMPASRKTVVAETLAYVAAVVRDFRLTELKRKSRWSRSGE